MYYEYDTGYYETSVIDDLLLEFKEKCTKVLLEDVNSQIGIIKNENKYLKKENDKLKTSLIQAEKSHKDVENFALMKTLTNGIKNTIKNAENKDQKIYEFLSLVFTKDYNEDVYNTPLWIGAMTQFYSNKEKVIEVLKLFDVKLPDNIENFRLPIDWNEEEMDIFFDTMYNHYNCNGCTYEGNLRFWSSSSSESVKTQCNRSYSEIPWQYVLRNPLLKNKKYLKKIGKNTYSSTGYSGHWESFYKIDSYLDLSSEEIKTILINIDETKLKKNGKIAEFVLRNLKYVEDDEFLKKIYSLFYDSYDFKYEKKILEMPYKYILQWVCDNKNDTIKFIEDNKEHFTEEQRKELLMKAVGL